MLIVVMMADLAMARVGGGGAEAGVVVRSEASMGECGRLPRGGGCRHACALGEEGRIVDVVSGVQGVCVCQFKHTGRRGGGTVAGKNNKSVEKRFARFLNFLPPRAHTQHKKNNTRHTHTHLHTDRQVTTAL